MPFDILWSLLNLSWFNMNYFCSAIRVIVFSITVRCWSDYSRSSLFLGFYGDCELTEPISISNWANSNWCHEYDIKFIFILQHAPQPIRSNWLRSWHRAFSERHQCSFSLGWNCPLQNLLSNRIPELVHPTMPMFRGRPLEMHQEVAQQFDAEREGQKWGWNEQDAMLDV